MLQHHGTRPGTSLAELLVVITILGISSALVVLPMRGYLDRLAARRAVTEAAMLVGRARDEAYARHAIVTLRTDTVERTIVLRARGEQFARRPLGSIHGVELSVTRDSIAFDVRGLGYGAANMTLVAKRGAAAETLVVSRLGRTRH